MTEKAMTKKDEAAVGAPIDWGAYSGAGFENQTNEDISIPFVALLQGNSPQVEEGLIEDAEGGMFFNSVTGDLFSEVYFIPCVTEHVFVEYVPRDSGGGFRGIHSPNSPLVKAAKDAAEEFGKNYVPAGWNETEATPGNELVEYFYIYALMLEDVDDVEPTGFAVLGFKSTAIKYYKNLMTRLRTFKGNPPLFAHRVKGMSFKDQNAKGKFFNWKLEPAKGDLTSSLVQHQNMLELGDELRNMVGEGRARAAHESLDEDLPI